MTIDIKKTGFTSMIFLIMIAVSLLVIQPVYESTISRLNTIRESMLKTFEDLTGLTVSYSSMSPSILSGLRISKIQIYDAEHNSVLAKIASIRFSINIFHLIRGEFDSAFETLIVTGLSAEFNQDEHKSILDKITRLVSTMSKSSEFSGLPFSIRISNATLAYQNKEIKLKIQLRETLVNNSTSGKSIQFSSNNTVLCSFVNESLQRFSPITSQFVIQGRLAFNNIINQNSLESAIQLRVRELKNDQISVKPIEVALWFSNDIFNVQILENDGTFNFLAEFNSATQDFKALLEAENFDPLNLIKLRSSPDLLRKASGTSLSGVYSVLGNVNALRDVSFISEGEITVPSTLIPKGMRIVLDAKGDLSAIDFRSVQFLGPSFDIEYTGTFAIPTLQPQGIATIHSVTLPNRNSLQTEIYLDPMTNGFLGFIPQVQIGNTTLTALQLEIIPDKTSIDFSLLFYDYSHYEYSENAEVYVNGSLFIEDKPFLQSNIEISNLFLDSVFGVLSYILPEATQTVFADAQQNFSTFIASTELYISTDFNTLTYNTPYSIIANTAKDQELAVFSFDGNETNLQISQLDVLFSGQNIQASASADFSPDYSDMFFSAQLAVNAIPYELQGVFVDKKNLVISGSYGLTSSMLFNSGSLVSGDISFNSFPLSIKNYVLSLSVETSFDIVSFTEWYADIKRFECVEATNAFSISPSLNLSGMFDSYGGMINSLTYSDTVSMVNGDGRLMWNTIDGYFESAYCLLSLREPFSQESYEIDISVSNPFKKNISELNLFKDIFCSGQISIQSSPLSRFLTQQAPSNTVSGQVTLLGTLENPSVSVRVVDSALNFQGERLSLQCFASLDDRIVTVTETSVQFASFIGSNVEANLDLNTFNGSLHGAVKTLLGSKNEISSEFIVNLVPTSIKEAEDQSSNSFNFRLPDTFLATISLPSIKSTQYGQIDNFSISLARTKGRFDIQGGSGSERSFTDNPITGYLLDSGECLLILDEQLPLSFIAYGSIAKGLFDIQVNDLVMRAEGFKKIFDLGPFKITQGTASGSLHLGGLLTDPEFSGSVDVSDFLCEVPDFIEGTISAAKTQITGQGKYLSAENVLGRTKDGNCFVDVAINFDKWALDSVVLHLKTPADEKVKAFVNFDLMEFSGNAECDLTITVKLTSIDVSGSLFVDDAVGRIYPIELIIKKEMVSSFDVMVDLDIMIGKRAQAFMYAPVLTTPIIRALVNPMTPIKVTLDTRENSFAMIGDLILRGGEVNIGRSFYLREGRMVFEQNQINFDPSITVEAEMRETDQNGELLRITLSAQDQKLSNFNYKLSSSPPKSESELMIILGQSFVPESSETFGDFVLNVAGASLNLLMQNTILKQIEDGLRDFLKLDILSFKTSVLQNTLKLYSEQNTGKILTPGNFLDNSTVYIGKYFGDVLYGDFLLHLSYDDSKVDSNNLASGIAFEPEIGFEMESPFATIRWSIAPDVGSLHNLWVPYTSISLSWKFMF